MPYTVIGPLINWGPSGVHFRGPLAWPIWGPREGSKARYWLFLGGPYLTFPDPPCQPGPISGFKMACTGVPHYYMFYGELAPLGGILVPLKSVWAFLPLPTTYFKPKHVFLQKGPIPKAELAENLCVDSQTPPRSGPKSWQMVIFGSKILLRGAMG